MFWCPGCDIVHAVDEKWDYNGNPVHPTFQPSVLATAKYPVGYTDDNPAPAGYDGPMEERRCHSFVRDGRIEYLTDCTHSFAGASVEMEPAPWWGDQNG